MIPERYSGIIHAVRLIWQEEGRKGIYRGFSLDTTYLVLACIVATLLDTALRKEVDI